MTLDPDPEEMRRVGRAAVERMVEQLAGLRDRPVHVLPDAPALRPIVAEPLPVSGAGLDACLDRFFDQLLPLATRVDHPRFFAYVPGPGSFAGALGAWLAAAANLFVGSWQSGAAFALLEEQVLDWMREALGLPADLRHGVLTTGGSMANLCAIAAARARNGDRGFRVFVSSESHYSLAKAARVLGVGADDVVSIPTDEGQRMRVGALAAALERDRREGRSPGIVCATAGTTSTGAIDPIADCATLCRAHEAWLHVDGAYGAAAALLPEENALRTVLADADSLTLDPHKWLYAPFESGCLLTRDPDALRAAFTGDGAYLQDVPRDGVNFFERGPELSRGARALPLWMLFRAVGFERVAAAIRDDMSRCRRAHDTLAADPRFEIVTPPRLSVFTFALRTGDDATRELLRLLLADGTTMLSSSRVADRFVLRFCVVNHRTTDGDVDLATARIRELAARELRG